MADHILKTDRSIYSNDPTLGLQEVHPSWNEMNRRRLARRTPVFEERLRQALEGVDCSTQAGQDLYWFHSLRIGVELDQEGY